MDTISPLKLTLKLLKLKAVVIYPDTEFWKLERPVHLAGKRLVVKIVEIEGFHIVNTIGAVLIIWNDVLKLFQVLPR